jgi:predicted transcriptional regulator
LALTSVAFIVFLVIAGVSSSVLEKQQSSYSLVQANNQHHLLVGSTSPTILVAGTTFLGSSANWAGNEGSANFSTRAMIMQYIVENPGVYLREMAEFLSLPVSVVQYHLYVLEKTGQVENYRNGRYKRFFVAGVYGETERKVISLMRQDTPGKILVSLANKEPSELSHTKLAKSLGITSQALTWQISKLKEIGIVESSFIHGIGSSYHLTGDVGKLVELHQTFSP